MGLISRVSSRTYRSRVTMAANKMIQDPEVAKVFNEYRQIMNFTEQKKLEINATVQQQQRNAKHDELVNKELGGMDNERKYYFAVGRMFMCQPKEQIMKTLEDRQKNIPSNNQRKENRT